MNNNLLNLEKKLKLKFNNQKLFLQSLTHKSFNSNTNNEKIEFLGDRVLGLAIAEIIYKKFPTENEGELAKRF